MGVVKTASESVLEDNVVPSEEANYSVQGYAGKYSTCLFYAVFSSLPPLSSLFSSFFLLFDFRFVLSRGILGARILLHRGLFARVSTISSPRERYNEVKSEESTTSRKKTAWIWWAVNAADTIESWTKGSRLITARI